MRTRRSAPVFVIRLRPGPRVDAIRALRAALKVLGRRFGLRAISTLESIDPAIVTTHLQKLQGELALP